MPAISIFVWSQNLAKSNICFTLNADEPKPITNGGDVYQGGVNLLILSTKLLVKANRCTKNIKKWQKWYKIV